MCLRPFGLYCSACLGILFVSILCTCCSHFSSYCFISFTIFSAPVLSLILWSFSLSSFVIPSRCLKNFICAASKRCSSLFFSTQASLPIFNAALAVMLWILNFLLFPKLKMKLKGRRFQTVGEIQAQSQAVLNMLRENDFQEFFKNWQSLWNPCQSSEVDYSEGDAVP